MRAAWYERTGPAAEVLVIGEFPDPVPQAGEVLVRLRASGINPSDVRRRSGDVPTQPFPRIVPHNDGAGEIVAVGSGVPPRRVGERVWLFKAQWQRPFGTAAELIALPAALAVPLPHGVSFEAGAALGIPALTAWYCLTCAGPLEGKRVLVTVGTGAVGQAAVQLARWPGPRRSPRRPARMPRSSSRPATGPIRWRATTGRAGPTTCSGRCPTAST